MAHLIWDNEAVISVHFDEGAKQKPTENVNAGLKTLKADNQDVIKALGVGLVLNTFNRELSVRGQLTGNYVRQNKIDVARNVGKLAYTTIAAFIVDPTLAAITLSSQLVGSMQEYRNIQIDYDKDERAANNIRASVGLEATNYSRYSGKRR